MTKHMKEIAKKDVERVAHILGAQSAAAKALARGAEMVEEGIDVAYYRMNQTLYVGPRIPV